MAGADGRGGGAAGISCVTLNTGHAMPVLGFGTGSSRTPDDLPDTILHAIGLGYRHLDTASFYGTERAVGAAVADAVRLGAVASRDDLFVTTKLWIHDAHPARVVPALRESLARLVLDYVDLFLVHWPVAVVKKEAAGAGAGGSMELVAFDMEGVWRGMEECHRLGLAKSIGVSNFSAAKMSRLLSFAAVPPAVNQVEMNVGWRQEKVRRGRCRRGRVLAARGVRHLLGLQRCHGEQRAARHRRHERQNCCSGGIKVAVRARRVLCGPELQQGEDEAEHGDLRLGAERRGEGDDRHHTTEKGLPGGALCVA